jgi:hypothetical protein
MVFLIQFFPMFLYELPRDLCTVHATSSDTRKGMRKILVSDLRSRTIYDRSPPSHITQYRDIISCTFVSTVFVMEVTRGSSWFLGIVYHKQDNDDLGFEHWALPKSRRTLGITHTHTCMMSWLCSWFDHSIELTCKWWNVKERNVNSLGRFCIVQDKIKSLNTSTAWIA